MTFTMTEPLRSLATLFNVAALATVRCRATIERDHTRTDFVQPELIERIVKKKHFGIGAVAVVLVFRAEDDRAGRSHPIDEVNLMQPHCADQCAVWQTDRNSMISGARRLLRADPLLLKAKAFWSVRREVLIDQWIVDAAIDGRCVAHFEGTQNDQFSATPDDWTVRGVLGH